MPWWWLRDNGHLGCTDHQRDESTQNVPGLAHARSNANVNSLCHRWPQPSLWPLIGRGRSRDLNTWPLIGQFPVSSHSRNENERVILSRISHANSQPIIQNYDNEGLTPISHNFTAMCSGHYHKLTKVTPVLAASVHFICISDTV